MKTIRKMALAFLFPMAAFAQTLPPAIQTVLNKPMYKEAKWGLRVVDLRTHQVLLDLNPDYKFFIGSVRKIFSVGELLDTIGPDHRFITTVHRDGTMNEGELKGNLVLVASGDLTMDGRTKPNGQISIPDFDHNEADSLGNAVLAKGDPLAGYRNLAQQVKKAGVNKIIGDVIIDERLFEHFNFRDEFKVSPIFVNDDVIDVIINPGKLHELAAVTSRPQSAAFSVVNNLTIADPAAEKTLALEPIEPQCIGTPSCSGEVKGQLPINFLPPYTNAYPLIQTFRITEPGNYARTVFIEALQKAGVDMSNLEQVKPNPAALLKNRAYYNSSNQIAALTSLPYSEYAKFILKVSYNIGADTSLVLFGLTQGVNSMAAALKVEETLLTTKYDIPKTSFTFIDGSGGGNTQATNKTVTKWLEIMTKSNQFKPFFDALPILATDGSLAFVKDFQTDQSLTGATGQVSAKTGTFVATKEGKLILEGQSFAGYIHTKKGNHLAYEVVVNNVPITSLEDVLKVFQDEGTLSAILWRDF